MTYRIGDDGKVRRGMTVAKLRAVLADLPADALVEGNQVGNLTILNGDEYLGYIDTGLDERYYAFEDDDG